MFMKLQTLTLTIHSVYIPHLISENPGESIWRITPVYIFNDNCVWASSNSEKSLTEYHH